MYRINICFVISLKPLFNICMNKMIINYYNKIDKVRFEFKIK